ncbi:MAG: hypothetical protein WCO33_01565 [bacterium]
MLQTKLLADNLRIISDPEVDGRRRTALVYLAINLLNYPNNPRSYPHWFNKQGGLDQFKDAELDPYNHKETARGLNSILTQSIRGGGGLEEISGVVFAPITIAFVNATYPSNPRNRSVVLVDHTRELKTNSKLGDYFREKAKYPGSIVNAVRAMVVMAISHSIQNRYENKQLPKDINPKNGRVRYLLDLDEELKFSLPNLKHVFGIDKFPEKYWTELIKPLLKEKQRSNNRVADVVRHSRDHRISFKGEKVDGRNVYYLEPLVE